MLAELKEKRVGLKQQLDAVKQQLDVVDDEIQAIIAPLELKARQFTGKDYGIINLELEGLKIKATVPKKVDWDQAKLADIWGAIKGAQDDPAQYIDLKYDVSESKYKAWPANIQAVFQPARTVKPGKPNYEL